MTFVSLQHVLGDAYVVKSSEIGSTAPTHTRTQLAHLLNPGDLALGFDIRSANLNEEHYEKFEQANAGKYPDVILVKKYYGDKATRNRRRRWKLRRLRMGEDGSAASADGRDYYDFMEDLEEDPMLRANVNIYKDSKKVESEMAVDEDDFADGEEVPQVTLQEMLDDLVLEDWANCLQFFVFLLYKLMN